MVDGAGITLDYEKKGWNTSYELIHHGLLISYYVISSGTPVKVMACYMMAPSHQLNQSWLITNKMKRNIVLRNSQLKHFRWWKCTWQCHLLSGSHCEGTDFNLLSFIIHHLNTYQVCCQYKLTSSNGNISLVTGHLCRELTGPRWIPRTKASNVELWCFLWSASE